MTSRAIAWPSSATYRCPARGPGVKSTRYLPRGSKPPNRPASTTSHERGSGDYDYHYILSGNPQQNVWSKASIDQLCGSACARRDWVGPLSHSVIAHRRIDCNDVRPNSASATLPSPRSMNSLHPMPNEPTPTLISNSNWRTVEHVTEPVYSIHMPQDRIGGNGSYVGLNDPN